MESIKISVVVPVYNVEKYLNCCIESIIHQTYDNLEIILIDDGSPDKCPQICDSWAEKDERIKVIHKVNAGLGMARNTGIEAATGDYICFVDSDDSIDLSAFEKAIKAIQSTGADVALYGLVNVNDKGEALCTTYFNIVPLYQTGEIFRNNLLPELISHNFRIGEEHSYAFSVCTGLFSLELINKFNMRFESERKVISEDSFFLLNLYSHIDSAVLIPEALYFRLVNTNSLSNTYRNDRFEQLNFFLNESVKLCKKIGYSSEIEERVIMLYHSFVITALKQIMLSDKSKKNKYKIIRAIIDNSTFINTLH